MVAFYGALLALTLFVAVMLVIGRAASRPLLRRPPPDPEVDPADLGLPAEPVTFMSRDNRTTLRGFWIPAPAARGTVVLCGGRHGSLDGDLPVYGPLFYGAGFNLLIFDWRAHGRSEGKYVTYGVYEKEDLLGALAFLDAAYGVTRVGVMGLSMGARAGLIAAALSGRVGALVCDSLLVRLDTGMARVIARRKVPVRLGRMLARWTLVVASFRVGGNLFHTDATYWAPHVTGTSVLLIYGEEDALVLGDEIEAVFAGLPGAAKALWRVPGAGHRAVYARQPEEYEQRVLDWFEEHLRYDTP